MIQKTILKYRYFIKSVCTYSLLYPSANYVQQKYFRNADKVDFDEVKRYWIYGSSVAPSLVYAWQKILNTLFPQITRPYIILKVCLETLCFAPFVISVFFYAMGFLESKTLPEIKKEYDKKFQSTYLTGVCYWSVVQTLNFRYVPFEYRTMLTSIMSFFWTIGLSYIKSLSIDRKILGVSD